MRKVRYIAVKELRHILRDLRSLMIAIFMPILMTLLYGYAINLDIKNIKLAIIDFDKTTESRELASKFHNSGYFLPPDASADITDPEKVLKTSKASAVLTIRSGFSRALTVLGDFEVGLLVDGADANTASAAASYSNIILKQHLMRRMPEGFEIPGVAIAQQVLYNPDMKSSHFFV
ncbi:MAG: ABC transporter permease, partial [Candidatus Zixiibacteriota bacterium]